MADIIEEKKTCSGPCGLTKSLNEFNFRKDSHKYRNECKKCWYMLCSIRRKSPKIKKVIETLPDGYKRCKGECREIKKENEFELRKDTNKLRSVCIKCCSKERMIRKKKDPEKYKNDGRQYYLDNKDELNTKQNKRNKIRRETDLVYRFICILRKQTNRIFRKNCHTGATKSKHTLEYLGCSPKEAIKHIESLWLPGMSWDNHGLFGWHIDHIIPIATIKSINDIEQINKVFHYTNLQPLWAEDNLKKGDKIISKET